MVLDRLLRSEAGFTLMEMLVGIALLSVATTAFYQVMFSGSRGSRTSVSVVEISEEARLGLNRMIRDTRQAGANTTGGTVVRALTMATPTGYSVEVDYNGDGFVTPVTSGTGTNPAGDFEQLSFVVVGGKLYIQACDGPTEGLDCGRQKSLLVDGVSQIGTTPYFSYSSNRLEYDCNNDGVATKDELESTACTVTGLTSGLVLASLTDVDYAFRVSVDDRSSNFRTHAQMRNAR